MLPHGMGQQTGSPGRRDPARWGPFRADSGPRDRPGSPWMPAMLSLAVADGYLPPPPVRGAASGYHRGQRDLRGGAVTGAVLPYVGASSYFHLESEWVLGPSILLLEPVSFRHQGVPFFCGGVESAYNAIPGY